MSLERRMTLMGSLFISILLCACESLTWTAALEKRKHAFSMRCFRRLLNISYKDPITNEDVCRKIQAAIEKFDELKFDDFQGQETKTKVVWPCFKVFW